MLNDNYYPLRIINGSLSALMTILCDSSKLDIKTLKAFQPLGEFNREIEYSLKVGLERNS